MQAAFFRPKNPENIYHFRIQYPGQQYKPVRLRILPSQLHLSRYAASRCQNHNRSAAQRIHTLILSLYPVALLRLGLPSQRLTLQRLATATDGFDTGF